MIYLTIWLSIMRLENKLDKLFMALASENRRKILHILSLRPQTTSQLSSRFSISMPAIHKNLGILSEAGLITEKKVGRVNFIALNPQQFSIAKNWINQYHTEWGNSSQTLDNYIQTYFMTNKVSAKKSGTRLVKR